MLGDTATVRATLSALMETGIRVSDVEIVRLTSDFSLNARLESFLKPPRAWAPSGAGGRQR
jgi:hypothetical protein